MNKTRFAALILSVSLLFCFCLPMAVGAENTKAYSDNPGITSGNAVVAYSMDDDQFLYTDRLDEIVAPTVAAKLMTCMVVSDLLKEKGIPASQVKVSVTKEAISYSGGVVDARVPTMGFKVGDSYSAKDLLSSTLVACANDAAAALASHFGQAFLGGDITDFVERMNQKALEMGLTNTNFVNPTGLDNKDQYSTPREIALIAAEFYRYNELVELADTDSFSFNETTTIHSKNFLKSSYYVKGFTNSNAIGLIAGQLDISGNYCLITASQKDGRTYIFVVMCAGGMLVEVNEETGGNNYSFGLGNAYDDMNKLIAWTRESFELKTLATTETIVGELRVNLGNSSDHVMIVPAENVEKLIVKVSDQSFETKLVYDEELVYSSKFNGVEYDTINAPVSGGQVVGKINYYYNGEIIATVDAVAKDGIDSDGVKATLDTVKNFLFGDVMKTVMWVIGGFLIVYVVIVIVSKLVKAGVFVGGAVSEKKNKKNKTEKTDNSKKKTEASKKTPKKSKDNKSDPNSETREMR